MTCRVVQLIPEVASDFAADHCDQGYYQSCLGGWTDSVVQTGVLLAVKSILGCHRSLLGLSVNCTAKIET